MRFLHPTRLLLVCTIACITTNAFARGWWVWSPGKDVEDIGYAPDQEINFSHKLHAGDRKIPCEYCHSSARRSITAGIPPTNTCMGCHRFVHTEAEPIKYLTEKFNKNEPMKWTKVHDLPDFVRFSHKVHVLAKIECQKCHGEVEKMEKLEQRAPLLMGWCVECHDHKVTKTLADGSKVEHPQAPVTCATCHY